jgi:hypothetical protein
VKPRPSTLRVQTLSIKNPEYLHLFLKRLILKESLYPLSWTDSRLAPGEFTSARIQRIHRAITKAVRQNCQSYDFPVACEVLKNTDTGHQLFAFPFDPLIRYDYINLLSSYRGAACIPRRAKISAPGHRALV